MPLPEATPAADLAACRRLLRAGSKSFYLASLMLPKPIRDPACALYAFCRVADDAVDVDDGGLAAVARLRERLDRLYAGAPLAIPADRALARVVARHGLPRPLLEALLDGFEWDAAGRRHDSLAEVEAYAARVAGTVGALMALLMGVRDADALARACSLGLAMQLTNIARDVGEDAVNGRLYLPRDWLREAGIDPDAWLAAPRFDARLGAIVERLLVVADQHYARVDHGIDRLPPACRPGIAAARLLYAEIGHELRRRGGDPLRGRTVVPARRKLALLLQARARRTAPVTELPLSPPAATAFLVDVALTAAPALPDEAAADRPPSWWRLDARGAGVLDLFERLEREERAAQARRRQVPLPAAT